MIPTVPCIRRRSDHRIVLVGLSELHTKRLAVCMSSREYYAGTLKEPHGKPAKLDRICVNYGKLKP